MDESSKTLEIRGQRMAPGELAFLYRTETEDFLFGNIEAVTDKGLLLSFEKPTWERRDDSVEVPFDQVLLPGEMSTRDKDSGPKFRANDVVLRTTSVDTAEALGVLASQEEANHPLLVSKIAWRDGQQWVLVGDPFVVKAGDIYDARTLSLVQRYRFCAPTHPLFDIFNKPVGAVLDLQQQGYLKLGGLDIPVGIHFVVKGHVVSIDLSAHYYIAMLLGGIKSEYYADKRVIPTDDRPPRWQASVAISGMSNNANVSLELTRFRGDFPSRRERVSHGKTPHLPAGVPA